MRVFIAMISIVFVAIGLQVGRADDCFGVTCSVKETLTCLAQESDCRGKQACDVEGDYTATCSSNFLNFFPYSVHVLGNSYVGWRAANYLESGYTRVCVNPDVEFICSTKARCNSCYFGLNWSGTIWGDYCGYPSTGAVWEKLNWSNDFTMSLSCVGDGA